MPQQWLSNRMRVLQDGLLYGCIGRKRMQERTAPSVKRGHCTRSARAQHSATTRNSVQHSATECHALL